MLHDLPYELLECILDHLHDDRETLRICSLVHRAWLPTTRYHLLNPKLITQCHDSESWSLETEVENVTKLLGLVSSPHCTILPAIEDVILFFQPSKRSSLFKEAIGILSKARSLKKVLFMDCDAAPIIWIAQEIPNIQELVYQVGSEDSSMKQDAIPFITSFTQLRSLSFYAWAMTDTVTIPAGPGGNPLAFTLLRTLRLNIRSSDEFLGWLLEYHSYIALETLVLSVYSENHEGWEGVDNLNRFLKAQSKSLKHLSLGISYTDTSEVVDLADRETALDLSVLTNLRSLTLRHYNINSICDALAQFTRPTFQILTIDILRCELATSPCAECNHSQLAAKLETLIGGPVFKSVPTIHLRLDPLILIFPDMVEVFTCHREPGSMQISAVDIDGYMVDSMHAFVATLSSRIDRSQLS